MSDQLTELKRRSAPLVHYDLPVMTGGHQLTLKLRRLPDPRPGSRAVLILHGGNSSSDTFLIPDGGLAYFLKGLGWDVWLLDWRGSPYVIKDFLAANRTPLGGSAFEECKLFTYDRVADEDVRAALHFVREEIGPDAQLSFIGHCVAGGVSAIALAKGVLDEFNVRNVVLVALGLFFEVAWDGWVKVEDFILERVLAHDAECRSIDPRDGASWPEVMQEAYDRWPCAWLKKGGSTTDEVLRRLTFMFGKPWSPELLVEGLDGPVLDDVFGPVHLGLYLHSGQMVRRGYAAPFEEVDLIDRGRLRGVQRKPRHPEAGADYLVPERFKTKNITLVTGSENRVWHRDSMDLMYEWLRGLDRGTSDGRYRKHIVPGFGLQDLFWRKDAPKQVWEPISEGLLDVGERRA